MGTLSFFVPLSLDSTLLRHQQQSLLKTHFCNPIFFSKISSIKLTSSNLCNKRVVLCSSSPNDSYESKYLDENGVAEDMDGYMNYLSLEYDSVWDTKPSWCQPWTIGLTGVSVIAGSWVVLHSVVITTFVLSLIFAWWYIFLYSYPKEEKCTEITKFQGTTGFTSPEMMLGCTTYGKPTDIWSIGCIFAEFVNHIQLFKGNNGKNSDFGAVIQKLGSGVMGNMDFIDNDEGLEVAKKSKGIKPGIVPFGELFPTLDNEAIDLMKKLLDFDPRSRITASAALEHPYLIKEFESYSAIEGYSRTYPEMVHSEEGRIEDTLRELIWKEMQVLSRLSSKIKSMGN